jgi:hypothetical protein
MPRLSMLHLILVLSAVCTASGAATDTASLKLRHADGQEGVLNRLEELPTALAAILGEGELRLVVKGRHKLLKCLHLQLHAGQRLVLEGDRENAVLELGELPVDAAAICLDAGQFEVRNLTMLHGPAWSVQISGGVHYDIVGLRILDARGGGIVAWGPCGVDQDGPAGNRIEKCSIERFNRAGAKWTNDGISVRDNRAVITGNIVRDSPTETMGIRVMGAANRIEGNLVKDVAKGDAGGIYLWGGEAIYTGVGNILRHNIVAGASRGIYLDDGTCAARVEQNYLIDCPEAAIFIGGGRNNLLSENIALRCPVLAHVDNRRVGWRDFPEKSAMFAAARARLTTALRDESFRAAITAGGLDVKAFETLPEATFNEPSDNRIIDNVLMPAALEIQWQNYARPKETLLGRATDPMLPNRLLPIRDIDWKELSGRALGISDMPDVTALLGVP